MKKFIAVFLAAVCIFSLAGCKDKNAEAAEEAAKAAVSKYYDVIMSGLEDLADFSLATHSGPTINKVEKESDGRYVVTGAICGTAMKSGVVKTWTADWKITVEKNSDGVFKVATSPKPDYGTIKYLD